MTKLTGSCLCGQVSYEADGEISMQGNCHCTDCQQTSGSPFATLIFMDKNDVKITGETTRFEHQVDSGNTLSKDFCPKCGSQMFGGNEARPDSIAIKAGSVNEKTEIKPQFNVYASRKLDCVILDPNIPAFDKMPG